MKVTTVTSKEVRKQKAGAFTLIEMIGVLAVIAILAALLIPKVFSAINDARVNNVVLSYNTIKTAVTDHYGKYGQLNMLYGTNSSVSLTNYDVSVLMAESLLDKPFQLKLGTNWVVQLVTGAASNNGQGYKLDGTAATITTNMAFVAEAVISGATLQDAIDISSRLDGTTLSTPSGADTLGRVEYAAGANPTIYMFLTGR